MDNYNPDIRIHNKCPLCESLILLDIKVRHICPKKSSQ